MSDDAPTQQPPAEQPAAPARAKRPVKQGPKRKRIIKRKTKGLWKKGDNQPGPNARMPNTYTPQVAKEYLTYYGSGCPMEVAASMAGVSRKTIHNWLKRGLRSKKLPDGDPEKLPVLEKFRRDVRRAKFRAITEAITMNRKAMLEGNVNAAQFLLKTRGKKWFTEKHDMRHSDADGQPLDFGPRIILNLPPNGRDITAAEAAAKAGQAIIDVTTAQALPPVEPKEQK